MHQHFSYRHAPPQSPQQCPTQISLRGLPKQSVFSNKRMITYSGQVPLLPLVSFMLHVARTLGINFNTKPNPPQDIPQIDIGMETRRHTIDTFPVRPSWESP